jgi:hypothetical protein
MSTMGGPGGINGPKGSDGPRAIDDASELPDTQPAATATAAAAAPALATTDLEALAAEVAAGRLTRGEAIDRVIDQMTEAMAGPGLDADARAELRELLSDLVANDPYLDALAGRI